MQRPPSDLAGPGAAGARAPGPRGAWRGSLPRGWAGGKKVVCLEAFALLPPGLQRGAGRQPPGQGVLSWSGDPVSAILGNTRDSSLRRAEVPQPAAFSPVYDAFGGGGGRATRAVAAQTRDSAEVRTVQVGNNTGGRGRGGSRGKRGILKGLLPPPSKLIGGKGGGGVEN